MSSSHGTVGFLTMMDGTNNKQLGVFPVIDQHVARNIYPSMNTLDIKLMPL